MGGGIVYYISTYRPPGRMRTRKVKAKRKDQNTFVDSSMWSENDMVTWQLETAMVLIFVIARAILYINSV